MKRPAQPLYVPAAFRTKLKNKWEDKIENTKCQYPREKANRQTHYVGKHESSQRRPADIVTRRVRIESSSSSYDPKNASDESCFEDDSSDFEECCSDIVCLHDLKISKETIENNSSCHWEKGESPPKNNRIESGETCTKISTEQLMQYEEYPDTKFPSNQWLNSEANKKKYNGDLFYDSADSNISDIEAAVGDYTRKGSVLTSTPYSDIVSKKLLDAAEYLPQEGSAMESILLLQNDLQITNNINGNDCNYNLEDHQYTETKLKEFSEICGDNYIPPPVPPAPHTLQLPLIHHLPSVSPLNGSSVPRNVFPQNMSHNVIQQSQPRLLLPSSLQIDPDLPRGLQYRPPLCSQAGFDPSFINPSSLLQGRVISPSTTQNLLNAPNLESHRQDSGFYIPPPAPPQQMSISNPKQCRDLQTYLLSTKAMMNKATYDSKMFPQNLK